MPYRTLGRIDPPLSADEPLPEGLLCIELHVPRWRRMLAWALRLYSPSLAMMGFSRALTFREAWAGRVVLLRLPGLG